jgi:hypothetical protein
MPTNAPQVSLITPDEVKAQLMRHLQLPHNDRYTQFYVNITSGSELYQGDVFRVRKHLKRKLQTDFVLLVSNTCDMQPDREDKILAIPLRQLPNPSQVHHSQRSKLSALVDNLTKYENTSFFYLPPINVAHPLQGFPGLYGAFGDIVSLSSEEISKCFNSKPEDRVLSLKETGFYILLIKLSVYFLRPDDRYKLA